MCQYLPTAFRETTQKPAASIKWQDGNQNLPPDFYLTLDGTRYIVEVTQIVEMVDIGGIEFPRQSIDGARDKLVNEVLARAANRGKLKGKYYILFTHLASSKEDFPRYRTQIIEQLVKIIEETQEIEAFPQKDVLVNGQVYCRILKVNSDDSVVRLGNYPVSAEFGEQSRKNACKYLENSISTKLDKLADFQKQKMLLILHNYRFLDIHVYAELDCLEEIRTISGFHTIFIVNGVNNVLKGLTLHSVDPKLVGEFRDQRVYR